MTIARALIRLEEYVKINYCESLKCHKSVTYSPEKMLLD